MESRRCTTRSLRHFLFHHAVRRARARPFHPHHLPRTQKASRERPPTLSTHRPKTFCQCIPPPLASLQPPPCPWSCPSIAPTKKLVISTGASRSCLCDAEWRDACIGPCCCCCPCLSFCNSPGNLLLLWPLPLPLFLQLTVSCRHPERSRRTPTTADPPQPSELPATRSLPPSAQDRRTK